MYISNNQSINKTPNFKKIKLSEAEFVKAENRLKHYINEPERKWFNEEELFKIMGKHLQREVDLKNLAQNAPEKRNIVVALYLKFFENLKSMFKDRNSSVTTLIEDLNHFSENYIPKVDKKGLPNYDIFAAHQDVSRMQEYLELSNDEFINIAKGLPVLQYKTGNDVEADVSRISKDFNLERPEILEMIKNNPVILLKDSNFFKKQAFFIKKYLNIDSKKELKEFLIKQPYIVTTKNIIEQIKDIAEFFETDEETIKLMIKYGIPILDPKRRYFKSNFYAMKDILKVDRSKMAEISLRSPVLFLNDPNFMKRMFEETSKELDIIPETFYRHAIIDHRMFRITPSSLRQIIDFMVSEYKFSEQEAKEYIKRNLYILKHGNDIKEQNQKVFEILNQELNIDYQTYLSIIKNEPGILGCSAKRLIQNVNKKELSNRNRSWKEYLSETYLLK